METKENEDIPKAGKDFLAGVKTEFGSINIFYLWYNI